MQNSNTTTIRVVSLSVYDAPAVADLHRSAISTGFLSALGQRFTERMYRAIFLCPQSFGVGLKDEKNQLLGFIICAENIQLVFRYCLVNHGLSMAVPLLRHAFQLSVIRRLWETLRYPSAVGRQLPQAEVLSIAVSPQSRSSGVGRKLMKAALSEFHRRGIDRVKVAVAAANAGACRFYTQCGFSLAATRQHHGKPMNIYNIRLDNPDAAISVPSVPNTLAEQPKPSRLGRPFVAQPVAQ